MTLRRLLAVALLAAAPGWAAAEWATIASTEAIVVEMDPDLVRKQGDFAMAYTRVTFTVPRPVERNPDVKQQSQLQLHAIDCNAGASTVVGVVLYPGAYGRGEAIEQTTRPRADWSPRPAPPGSLAEVTVRLACAELARRGTQ
ncbi:MAG: surface-adhesin E family protein [Bacteroidota bacterium]|jgi:hypothetical protein